MKIKKILAFLLAGTMMLSMSACGEKESDDDDDEDSSSSSYSIATANANAKTAYNAVMAFAQKSETAAKKLAADEDVVTNILKIDTSNTESAKVGNITSSAVAGSNKIADGAQEELIKAISHSFKDNEDGSCVVVIFNNKGFPKAVYWAGDETNEIVGKYPAAEDDVLTSGGIESIANDGDSAFGDIFLAD